MLRRICWIVLAAWIPGGCGSKSGVSSECIYADVRYSIGATLCAPALATQPDHNVLECTFNGANEPPRWVATGRPCDPALRTTGTIVSGSAAESHK